jgi:Tfp pilus assembly protein PilW
MASTSLTSAPEPRIASVGGFTLLEAMLATVISGIVFAGVLSAYIFLGRGLTRQGNEEQMESSSRVALYYFTQDVNSATSVDPTNLTPTAMSLYSPDSSDEIIYTYTPPAGPVAGTLVRTTTGAVPGPSRLTLLSNLTSFAFTYYNFVPALTTAAPAIPPAAGVKQVNMAYSAVAGLAASGAQSTLVVTSPRVSLKNKGLLGQSPGLP